MALATTQMAITAIFISLWELEKPCIEGYEAATLDSSNPKPHWHIKQPPGLLQTSNSVVLASSISKLCLVL